jgi:hypothetical protein
MLVVPLADVQRLLNDLVITNGCVCEHCEPQCTGCVYCVVHTTLAAWALAATSDRQQLINALHIYMDHDECVCDPCIDPGCQGCMYCIAHSALVAVGELEQAEAEERRQEDTTPPFSPLL